MEPGWQIHLLGGLRAERAGQVVTHLEFRQVRSLLGYLAYHLNRAHPRETLLELLWPDEDPDAYRGALVELAERRASLGDLAGAVADARRAVAADPFRESAHCLLIRLYALAGRRPDALRQYRELERILREELGSTPSVSSRAL